jgi:archaellum component FlaF (FlaF/FlaG flagellin family)
LIFSAPILVALLWLVFLGIMTSIYKICDAEVQAAYNAWKTKRLQTKAAASTNDQVF